MQSDTVAGQVRLDAGLKRVVGGHHEAISIAELCTRVAPLLLPLEPHTLSYTVRWKPPSVALLLARAVTACLHMSPVVQSLLADLCACTRVSPIIVMRCCLRHQLRTCRPACQRGCEARAWPSARHHDGM